MVQYSLPLSIKVKHSVTNLTSYKLQLLIQPTMMLSKHAAVVAMVLAYVIFAVAAPSDTTLHNTKRCASGGHPCAHQDDCCDGDCYIFV